MSATPPARTEAKQGATGSRLLMIGGVVIVAGLLILLLVDGGIGAAVMVLGALPAVAGLVLLGSAAVGRRSRQGKDWA
jgi:uncharacterized membrane protein HdeD (DUF308 family)